MSQEFKYKYEKQLGKDPKFRKGDFKTYNLEPSKTRQEFTKDCDINRIIAKSIKTGMLPPNMHSQLGVYADVSKIDGFRSVLESLIFAKESFTKLGPEIRKRFQDNPEKLLQFLNEPENRAEAIKLGLVDKKSGEIIKEPGEAPQTPVEGENTPPAESGGKQA